MYFSRAASSSLRSLVFGVDAAPSRASGREGSAWTGAVVALAIVAAGAAGESLLSASEDRFRKGDRVRLENDPRVWTVTARRSDGLLQIDSRGYVVFARPMRLTALGR